MNFNSNYCDGFFDINTSRGFLPINDPLEKLPDEFSQLQQVVDNIPSLIQSSESLEKEVNNIPNYICNIPKYENDKFVIQALFRTYTFIASSYLLQPSYLNRTESGYGKARTLLPKNIAVPLEFVANVLQVYPFLDYHYAYSLGNYKKIDKSSNLNVNNLDTICKFSGTDDERGFIMIHVNINQYSSNIIKGIDLFTNGNKRLALLTLLEAMILINQVRSNMWKVSNPKNYNDFRAFIMGITGNTEIFGDGVIYEGTSNLSPRQYRGQTGAQDDVIPTIDIFTGVIKYYPQNELTKYLYDLRSYRPVVVQNFFKDLENFTIDYMELNEDNKIVLYEILEQIYDFRNGHWRFVHEYIMKNTKYQVATGGTPIISWIPNQINSVLTYMDDVLASIQSTQFAVSKQDDLKNKQKILQDQLQNLKTTYDNTTINKSSCSFTKE